MTHTHQDSVASRPACMCAAYGCPLIGTMTAATTGTSEWWCALHFAKDAALLQSITSAMHRHQWLADAITTVRANAKPKHDWSAEFNRVLNAIHDAGHDRLLHQQGETAPRWITRLEAALMVLVAQDVQPTVVTQGGLLAPDAWTKAEARLPQWA